MAAEWLQLLSDPSNSGELICPVGAHRTCACVLGGGGCWEVSGTDVSDHQTKAQRQTELLAIWKYERQTGRQVCVSRPAGASREFCRLGGTFQLQLLLTLNGSSFQAGTARQSAHSNRSRREIMNACHICCDFDVSLERQGARREVRSPSLMMSVRNLAAVAGSEVFAAQTSRAN